MIQSLMYCLRLHHQIYGGYYRELQVDIQSSLAEANSVAEEMVSSMTTVKSHAAETFAEGAAPGLFLPCIR